MSGIIEPIGNWRTGNRSAIANAGGLRKQADWNTGEQGMASKIKTIGVLTSGGDAPGMNAAIRAVVRMAINKGIKVKGIYQGYKGLLNEEIVDLDARAVSDTISKGGTFLYTARSMEFRTPEGQKQASE